MLGQSLDLNAIFYFVTIVDCGTFTEASRRLGIPKSTLSDKVSDLERSLGVTLMLRTTRRIKWTDDGERFYHQAILAVKCLEAAQQEVQGAQQAPCGVLRISAPPQLATQVLLQAIAEYRLRFPDVKVELDLTGSCTDLLREGYDLALRPGPLPGSNLVTERVGLARRILVTSPKYLAEVSKPSHPEELSLHQCLTLMQETPECTWELRSSKNELFRISLTPGISSNSLAALKDWVLMGQGIALLPHSLCKAELSRRKLIRLLPDWASPEIPVYLLYPAVRYRSARVREMLPILEPALRALYH